MRRYTRGLRAIAMIPVPVVLRNKTSVVSSEGLPALASRSNRTKVMTAANGTPDMMCLIAYLPTTRILKLPGTLLGLGCGLSLVEGGGGPYSATERKSLWVFKSSAI